MRSSVDLPEPDGPKMTTCSPAWTVRSTPWSTSLSPYDFLIPRNSTTAAVSSGPRIRVTVTSSTTGVG